jgi:hypothetical protein
VNNLPLAANRAKIEKVRLFILQVSEEQKAAHRDGIVGVLFRPSLVFAKESPLSSLLSSRLTCKHPPDAARGSRMIDQRIG